MTCKGFSLFIFILMNLNLGFIWWLVNPIIPSVQTLSLGTVSFGNMFSVDTICCNPIGGLRGDFGPVHIQFSAVHNPGQTMFSEHVLGTLSVHIHEQVWNVLVYPFVQGWKWAGLSSVWRSYQHVLCTSHWPHTCEVILMCTLRADTASDRAKPRPLRTLFELVPMSIS